MGCNTSKEANVQPVENGSAAGCGDEQGEGKTKDKNASLGAAADAEKEQMKENLDNEEEQAAIKIQSAFRGHQTRKTMKSGTGDNKDAQEQSAAEEKAAMEAEFSPEDEELCNAATKIQASFRGHMARKQGGAPTPNTSGKTEEELSKEMGKLDAKGEEEENDELADIDLNDPELNKAATKIQASFRGHKVRKETGDGKEGEENKGESQ